jgi:hypothetical protein
MYKIDQSQYVNSSKNDWPTDFDKSVHDTTHLNSPPTEDTFRQCGHRARALLSVLNCNKSRHLLCVCAKLENFKWVEKLCISPI